MLQDTINTNPKPIRHVLTNTHQAIALLEAHLQLKELPFIKDYSIENYRFHFYSPTYKMAIEIDSYVNESYPVFNTDQLKKLSIYSLGVHVFRFTDYQILTDMEEVSRTLKHYIKIHSNAHVL
ncbi:DUF559 domain-containing protein [Aquimarina brevivitae]|uniref:Very-short-patch-repair endonuclease n=1 Tax=Aquimarina brevivitae TaxID=323412 RepID=A0A4Q7NZ63_9FLAO|nr:DUF559 domain-containing protein [Aquimarina brevivitae]RZS92288.1 very-short-patch-repair endonuclease [Aquimarina brevivitae]